jgi:hydroxymethylbilane synthase
MTLVTAPTVRIGTRGSALAMTQARIVADALRAAGEDVRIDTIETEGDRRAPDTPWGEGAFVTAIETALVEGVVDVAVHSAKDLPTDEDHRLAIAAFLPREAPEDVLVLPAGRRLGSLDELLARGSGPTARAGRRSCDR